jgi:mRNA-degrading endonuclease RelE of RelBE toxin-antitoxin system
LCDQIGLYNCYIYTMLYDIRIHKQAHKKLLAMSADQRHKVAQAIYKLGTDPDSVSLNIKALH